jgi:hypothetical protein
VTRLDETFGFLEAAAFFEEGGEKGPQASAVKLLGRHAQR